MTVLEVIQRSTEFLARHGVESPRLQTELLLAHVLKLPRLKLYLNFGRELAESELAELREMVQRRSRREPVQHILGSASFCGLEIAVNRNVLVPRPETELLAEKGWQWLLQRGVRSAECGTEKEPEARSQQPIALDFGTGSGCLAIALAVHCPGAQVHAVDLSLDALEVARRNAGTNGIGERIEFFHGDGFGALPAGARYDLIISNPPYIPSAEIASLDPEVRDFDPRQALDGGEDGLDYFRRLAEEAADFLAVDGRLLCEFGDGQAPALRELFAGQMWIVEEVVADYSARERILVARKAE